MSCLGRGGKKIFFSWWNCIADQKLLKTKSVKPLFHCSWILLRLVNSAEAVANSGCACHFHFYSSPYEPFPLSSNSCINTSFVICIAFPTPSFTIWTCCLHLQQTVESSSNMAILFLRLSPVDQKLQLVNVLKVFSEATVKQHTLVKA